MGEDSVSMLRGRDWFARNSFRNGPTTARTSGRDYMGGIDTLQRAKWNKKRPSSGVLPGRLAVHVARISRRLHSKAAVVGDVEVGHPASAGHRFAECIAARIVGQADRHVPELLSKAAHNHR